MVTALAHTPDGSVSATLMVRTYASLPSLSDPIQCCQSQSTNHPYASTPTYTRQHQSQDPTGVRVQGCVHTELVEEYGPELAVGAVLLLAKARFRV